ncbi:cupin domain-containing protein [Lysinibacillus sp. NPDC097195]|uniref:cupin domain-containing protein n=1 Tax=Lysinibacillus sp. NPDC097195 TaxID=3364141 RepID=UPI00382DAE07
MEMYNFTKNGANVIRRYNSLHAFYSKIIKTVEPTSIGFIYIEAGGVVGLHEAPVPQLFIVIEGEGWVCDENGGKQHVKKGDGVFWKMGQAHQSGSDKGLTALVIESTQIDLPKNEG